MTNSIWTSDYDVVHRCTTDHLQLSVAAYPAKMLAKWIAQPSNFQVLAWELTGLGARAEFYVRGNDLVERYQRDKDGVSTEIYTRVDPQRGAVELIVSRQTDLLDSLSELELTVRFDDANSASAMNPDGTWAPPGLGDENRRTLSEAMAVAIGCLDAVQYGVFVWPGDSEAITAIRMNEETVEVRIPLFGQPLEKGVIRRSRVLFARAEGNTSMQQLADRYQAFVESEIPLTT